MDKSLLSIKNLNIEYNGNYILKDINLSLDPGTIVSILGEEGSGKSTLVKGLTQQVPYYGTIQFSGIDLISHSTENLYKLGIDYLMQGGCVLNTFNGKEHLSLASSLNMKSNSISKYWHKIESTFPNINKILNRLGGTLSGGERIILSLCCIIVSDADLVILDEPTSGLAQDICENLFPLFTRWKEDGKTILLAEHNFPFAFDISDKVHLLKDKNLSDPFYKEDFSKEGFIMNNLY